MKLKCPQRTKYRFTGKPFLTCCILPQRPRLAPGAISFLLRDILQQLLQRGSAFGMSSFRFYVSGKVLFYPHLSTVGHYTLTEHLPHTKHSSDDGQLQRTPEHNTTVVSVPAAPFLSLLSFDQRQTCLEASNLLRNPTDILFQLFFFSFFFFSGAVSMEASWLRFLPSFLK